MSKTAASKIGILMDCINSLDTLFSEFDLLMNYFWLSQRILKDLGDHKTNFARNATKLSPKSD